MSYLQEVCRIGGRKFSSCKQSTRYPVEKYKHELNSVFSIDIAEDDPEVHPQNICILCQRALKRASEKSTYCGGGCPTQLFIASAVPNVNSCLIELCAGRPFAAMRVWLSVHGVNVNFRCNFLAAVLPLASIQRLWRN